MLRSRHPTGLTLLATAAFAVGLSVAPLPDALRPFPAMARGSAEDVIAAVLPRAREPVAVSPLPAAPELADAGSSALAQPAAPAAPSDADLAVRLLGIADQREVAELEALRAKAGAREIDIEPGCRQVSLGGGCEAGGLAPFFRDLDALLAGTRTQPVRVVHFGDSLIASDHITDVVRERLQARFGSAGTGFLFVDRPTRSGLGARAGRATEGWEIAKVTDRGGPARPVGFSGAAFLAEATEERADFDVQGAGYAELFFLTDPHGGAVQLRADGQTVARILTRFTGSEPAFARARVPQGARTLTLLARGRVSVYGVALERGGPGVIYDSLGIPGATAKLLLRADRALFAHQLAHRAPSLVVVMLGGNEAFELSRGETQPEEARQSFTELVQRIRAAVPDAACLLTSPMDAGTRTLGGALAVRPGTEEVAAVIRDVALQSGCAYWDLLGAMGGKGAVARWDAAGLMNEDLIHPRDPGADLLGHLLDVALARAHLARSPPLDPPGLESKEALSPLFERLRALEQGRRDRVAIVQLGASHTAAHYFTDAVRARLAAKFGAAGRGFVAAGRASPRLASSGTSRSLSGEWAVLDAVNAPAAAREWGLTGIRAEGQAGAAAEFRFCEGCDGQESSRLQLHYLEAPGMGRMEVAVDGERLAALPDPLQETRSRAARVLELEVPGPRHVLSVTNAGPGPLSIFGAAHELARPGVVLDALGLPGATVFNLASFDAAALSEQLRARRPDAFFLFYGTNESALRELDLEAMRARYDEVFAALGAVAPGAACLLIGPTDRQEAGPHGWHEASSQRRVISALREVARAHGCGFWSARAAMGGPGSIHRWLEREPPLANADHVHLTPEGYALLANAFADELLAAYAASGEAR